MKFREFLTFLRGVRAISKNGYLRECGWFQSYVSKQSVDAKNNPVPWISYSAIDFLNTRITKEMTLFEYGSGSSTRWYSERAKKVVCYEHDKVWHENIKFNIPSNVSLHLKTGDDYFDTTPDEFFSIVVVDGLDRNRCLNSILKILNDTGIIIWDDSHRVEYFSSFKKLTQIGFKRIDFSGLGPLINDKVTTTVFYRQKNCIGL
ncbi:FkbM family methyltransferase [Lentisphaerota bacterium ZTH]|nr:FkbM family methyltransferase [Lentisphaerota bacterium]WET06405.1 FkbM family methyltransferase [Lentisphaerota bacterium ZTH]